MNLPDFKKSYVVYRRVAELLVFGIILSVVITFLNISGLVIKRNSVVLMISAFVIVFTVFNFINLRNCYFDLRNKKLFFILNFLSNVIFAGVNFAVLVFAKNEVYTWLFSITKGLKFLGVDVIYSVILFHFIQLLCIIVSTIGMEWIFDESDEDFDENEEDIDENEEDDW